MVEPEERRYGLRAPFKCEVCEKETISVNIIPQCIVCSKQLCNECNKYELCPEHFTKLSEDDQNYLVSSNEKIVGFGKKVKYIVYITLFLMMTALIPVFSSASNNLLIFFIVIFCLVIVVFSLVIIIIIKRTKYSKEVQFELKNILKKYNFS